MRRRRLDVLLTPACTLPACAPGGAASNPVACNYTALWNLLDFPAGVQMDTLKDPVFKTDEIWVYPTKKAPEQKGYREEQRDLPEVGGAPAEGGSSARDAAVGQDAHQVNEPAMRPP